ncbi:MAG: SDR family oxidoreductase [Saprospiraceae bacterium]|nr:SDR family oxidoreductase [Saprospiraceae bacterium]
MNHRHIIITGGAKGIGLGCVEAFVRGGCRVTILDIDESGPRLGERLGKQVHFIYCDVAQEQMVSDALSEAIARFGEVEVLINNAGIQRYSTVTETTEEEWDLVMNVNLKSAFFCAKHAIPSMQRRGGGIVINISSVQAFVSQEKVAPYTTSKTAMLGLTRSIAIDYAPQIRCVAICPGTVDTPMLRNAIALSPDPAEVYNECVDMHLLKKIGVPSDIGELAYFLAGENAGFFTGQAIRVDGGLGIRVDGSKRS